MVEQIGNTQTHRFYLAIAVHRRDKQIKPKKIENIKE